MEPIAAGSPSQAGPLDGTEIPHIPNKTSPAFEAKPGLKWPGKRLLILIFCLSLIIRIVYVLVCRINPDQIDYDAVDYEILARNVLAGNGFGYGEGKLSSFRPPLWPYTLAGIYAVFGRSHTAAKLCLALIGSALPILIILITRDMLPRRESLACGIVVAAYPPLVVMAGDLMTETMFSVLIAAVMLIAVRWKARPHLKLAIALGAAAGFAALTRGNALVFIPLLLLWMVATRGARGLAHAVIVAAAAAAVLSPWTIRNWRLQYAFVPVSCNSGYIFSISFFPHPISMLKRDRAREYANGVAQGPVRSEALYDIVAEDNLTPPDFLRKNMADRYPDEKPLTTEFELDRFLLAKSVEFVKAHPHKMALKVLKDFIKFWYFFDSWGNFMPAWATVMPFVLVGVFITFHQAKAFALIYLLLASVILTVMVFHAAVRFRLPYEPFLLILAVVGSFRLWSRLRRKWILCLAFLFIAALNGLIYTQPHAARSLFRRAASFVGMEVYPGEPSSQ